MKKHYICTKLFNLFIINIKTLTNMRKITLLLFALFAFVVNAMADIPATGALGYFYNPSTGRFIGITSEYAPILNETGTEYGIRNEGAANEFSGFTYIRIAVHDEYMKLDKKGTEEASNENSTGNCLRLVTTLTSKNAGYHKWAAQDSEKGWLIRCIYTKSQISTDYEPQGYYLAASIFADGTASLTMSEDLTDACYWKFVSGDDYETAKASADQVFAAAKVAAFNALVDALLESVPTDTENMDADVKFNLDAAVAALKAEKNAENYNALEKAIAAANESIENNKQAAENAEKLKDLKVGDELLAILFPNAGFEASNNADGWTVTTNGGNNPSYKVVNGNCGMTKYQGTIKMEKTLRGLPAGWYTLKAQAFGRKGDFATNKTKFEAGEELETPGVIFANEETKQVPNVFEGLIDETDECKFVVESDNENRFDLENPSVKYFGQVTVDGVKKYVLDNSNSGSYAFSVGKYETELKVYVGEGEALSFGFDKNTANDGDYCGCDNFRLIYLGADPATAVSSVEKKAPVKAIFNVAGQKVSAPVKGLNIIDGKKVYIK